MPCSALCGCTVIKSFLICCACGGAALSQHSSLHARLSINGVTGLSERGRITQLREAFTLICLETQAISGQGMLGDSKPVSSSGPFAPHSSIFLQGTF